MSEKIDESKKDDGKATEDGAENGKSDAGDVDPEVAALIKDPAAIKALLKAKRDANDEAKKRRLKAEADDKKALEEQGKFKELAGKHEANAKAAQDALAQRSLNWAIRFAAMKAGAIDPDDVAKLLDRSALALGEDGETVTGMDEAIKALAEKKPHLFKGGSEAEPEKPAPKADPKPSLNGVVRKVDDGTVNPIERIMRGLTRPPQG